jgi:hypothetical protein
MATCCPVPNVRKGSKPACQRVRWLFVLATAKLCRPADFGQQRTVAATKQREIFKESHLVGIFKKRRPLPESEVAKFLTQIERLVSLLDEEGETFWKARIVGAASKVWNSDWQGFDDFLSGYGTSGSFNECSIRVGEWQGENHLWTPADKLRYQESKL